MKMQELPGEMTGVDIGGRLKGDLALAWVNCRVNAVCIFGVRYPVPRGRIIFGM